MFCEACALCYASVVDALVYTQSLLLLLLQHNRAVMYFSRALRLNRKFHEAWTLLGHEYLELKVSREHM
jgi:hypothetical protein